MARSKPPPPATSDKADTVTKLPTFSGNSLDKQEFAATLVLKLPLYEYSLLQLV